MARQVAWIASGEKRSLVQVSSAEGGTFEIRGLLGAGIGIQVIDPDYAELADDHGVSKQLKWRHRRLDQDQHVVVGRIWRSPVLLRRVDVDGTESDWDGPMPEYRLRRPPALGEFARLVRARRDNRPDSSRPVFYCPAIVVPDVRRDLLGEDAGELYIAPPGFEATTTSLKWLPGSASADDFPVARIRATAPRASSQGEIRIVGLPDGFGRARLQCGLRHTNGQSNIRLTWLLVEDGVARLPAFLPSGTYEVSADVFAGPATVHVPAVGAAQQATVHARTMMHLRISGPGDARAPNVDWTKVGIAACLGRQQRLVVTPGQNFIGMWPAAIGLSGSSRDYWFVGDGEHEVTVGVRVGDQVMQRVVTIRNGETADVKLSDR
jgi:hypothetical protein